MMETAQDVSDLNANETDPNQATVYWTTVTNPSDGWTYINVPRPGTLWVIYSSLRGAPASQIEVWHKDGRQPTKINANVEQKINVGEGDRIMYQLANPGRDSISLAYTLT